MKEKFKNNKGITLIALVITIIVMLILVTVTIRVSTEGALFTHAANAASRTKAETVKENALLDGNVGNKSIETIVAEQTAATATTIHFTIAGDDNEYEVPAGTTWGEWAAGQENYDVLGNNKINVGGQKGHFIKLNGDVVYASSIIENANYTVGS